jgi:C4-dicarboxylate transporter/malic acid transport protein
MEKHGGELTYKQRLRHMTWAWFTCSMSTGGIALVLGRAPFRFQGLDVLGKTLFIFDLVLFTSICIGLVARFCLLKGTLTRSLTHRTESLFFASFWLSFATILNNIEVYGVSSSRRWLISAEGVLFWIYTACTLLLAIVQYWYIFKCGPKKIESLTPVFILPIFPVMLCGTIAATIAGSQPAHHAVPILIAGVTCQGLGFVVFLMVASSYIGRLIISGLPEPNMRPGMFLLVGPPSFTTLALIGMSSTAKETLSPHFITQATTVPTADVILIVAVFFGVFLWALSFWFLSLAIVCTATCARQMKFRLSWWGFIFPNVGFTISTIEIGKAVGSTAILQFAGFLTCVLVAAWLLVAGCHVKAVWQRQILWPGMDEDVDEEYGK